jgi:hypothetical protein
MEISEGSFRGFYQKITDGNTVRSGKSLILLHVRIIKKFYFLTG